MEQSLLKRLIEYQKSDVYGFHMPGHKRNETLLGRDLPYGIDITEIEGFDDLHHAEGILVRAQERAARLYHSEETHFLVNGSSVGILSAILGTTARGDKILMARNCHKSAYHGVELNGLRAVYLYPKFEVQMQMNVELEVEEVVRALEEHPDAKAVMIVSPTYDGVVSDVEAIAEEVHRRGIPLIVDEAHGAHFGFHPYFPENANQKGADIVIHSVHKTLPALTQTALLHMNGTLVNRRRVEKYLHMLQSSSPSYVLMAGIDRCMELLEQEGDALFEAYVARNQALRENLSRLQHIKLLETQRYDRSKFVFSVKNTGMTSRDLYQMLLENYHLQMEMCAGTYVIAMTSIADTDAGFDRLQEAMCEIDALAGEPGENGQDGQAQDAFELLRLNARDTIAAAVARAEEARYVSWQEAQGQVALEYAYVYPPGIPFVVPGEAVTGEVAEQIAQYERLGFQIEGPRRKHQIGIL